MEATPATSTTGFVKIEKIKIQEKGTDGVSTVSGIFFLERLPESVTLWVVQESNHFRATQTREEIQNKPNNKIPQGEDAVDWIMQLCTGQQVKLSLNGEKLQVSVSKQVGTMSRKIWSAELERVSGEELIWSLVKAKDTVESKQKKAEAETEQACEAANEWIETANNLEGRIETERANLLKNFLQLYKKKDDLCKAARQEASQLRDQVNGLQEELKQAKTRNRITAAKEAQATVPSDDDDLQFDDAMVARLAGTAAPAAKKPKPKRKKPATATKKHDNDGVVTENQPRRRRPAKAVSKAQSESDDDTMVAKNVKRRKKAEIDEESEGGETDEWDSAIDMELHNSILAGLAAEKAKEESSQPTK